MASDNRSLGQFNLTGIPPAPRGVPQIEVEFNIDANGILHVTARDKSSGKEQSIEIKGSTGLSEDEVERMKKEAEEHAEEDKKRREFIESKNKADTLVYQTRKALEEHGDKVSQETRTNVERALSDVEEKMKGEDKQALDNAMQQLEQASMELGKVAYEQASQEQEAGAGAESGGGEASSGGESSGGKDEDVIDAEYEVKRDQS